MQKEGTNNGKTSKFSKSLERSTSDASLKALQLSRILVNVWRAMTTAFLFLPYPCLLPMSHLSSTKKQKRSRAADYLQAGAKLVDTIITVVKGRV